MYDITKEIQRLEIYKKVIKIFYWLLSPIGITLSFRFPKHYICIFIISLLLMSLSLVLESNINYQIESWEKIKKKVE